MQGEEFDVSNTIKSLQNKIKKQEQKPDEKRFYNKPIKETKNSQGILI